MIISSIMIMLYQTQETDIAITLQILLRFHLFSMLSLCVHVYVCTVLWKFMTRLCVTTTPVRMQNWSVSTVAVPAPSHPPPDHPPATKRLFSIALGERRTRGDHTFWDGSFSLNITTLRAIQVVREVAVPDFSPLSSSPLYGCPKFVHPLTAGKTFRLLAILWLLQTKLLLKFMSILCERVFISQRINT